MAIFNEDISINSIIGTGSKINGDMKINGFVRIDGDLDGNLETTGNVIIGENARVHGNILAKSITVGGVIKGNIIAPDSVHLLSKSLVLGDIQTHHFQADENVLVHGHCISLSGDSEYEEAVERFEDSKAISSHSILKNVHFHKNEKSAESLTSDTSKTNSLSSSESENISEVNAEDKVNLNTTSGVSEQE